MLDARRQQLTKSESALIAGLVQRADFILLLKIIGSLADEKVIEASKKALGSEGTQYLAVAEAELKSALRYKVCLEVLDELSKAETLYTVKVSNHEN